MQRWNGRYALVTGASAGIGAEICKTLVGHGINVIGCARRVGKIEELAKDKDIAKSKGKLFPMKCDLSIESDIISMFKTISKDFGRIDICINNAGKNLAESTLLRGENAEWRNMFKVNVLATCICSREALKLMGKKETDEGQIINISSLCDREIPPNSPDMHFFCGTKSMVTTLSKCLRMEVPNNIRVSVICPGLVKTDFVETCWGPDMAKTVYTQNNYLIPKDIAEVVVYILKSPLLVELPEIRILAVEKKTKTSS